MDHFARLGLPAALGLDAAALDRAYFAGQRKWHPDRFAGRPPEERARASAEAAALNEAYRTLKDPLSRAVYFAHLNGVDLPGDGRTIDDPELLLEVLETREALHEAETVEAVDVLAQKARSELEEVLASLGSSFLHPDKGAIRKALLRLRYLDKFAEEARVRRTTLEQAKA